LTIERGGEKRGKTIQLAFKRGYAKTRIKRVGTGMFKYRDSKKKLEHERGRKKRKTSGETTRGTRREDQKQIGLEPRGTVSGGGKDALN